MSLKPVPEFSKLCSEISLCRNCFTEFVMEKFYGFYDGSLNNTLMIIGQSPIYPLPKVKTKPFSLMDDEHQHYGSKWLRDCFNEVKLDYMDCYLTNLVKDSAKDNKINKKMIKNCSFFLKKEISMFKGKIILALGSPCCNYFKIKPFESKRTVDGKYIFGSRHPAFLMRKGNDGKKEFIEVLKDIKYLINTKQEKTLNDY